MDFSEVKLKVLDRLQDRLTLALARFDDAPNGNRGIWLD
jgi:hypothetical protein